MHVAHIPVVHAVIDGTKRETPSTSELPNHIHSTPTADSTLGRRRYPIRKHFAQCYTKKSPPSLSFSSLHRQAMQSS